MRPDHLPPPPVVRNGPLLEKVAAIIEEMPDRWDQDHFVMTAEEREKLRALWEDEPDLWADDLAALRPVECGTTYCIAGWASVIANPEIEEAQIDEHSGAEALGLDAYEAGRLFYGGFGTKAEDAAEALRRIANGEDVYKVLAEINW